MPVNRFFTESSLDGREVTLSADESHHLIKVLRAQIGDTAELCDGKGSLVVAQLIAVGKQAKLKVLEAAVQAPKQPSFVLRQAVCSASHLDLIVEKATELGASCIALFAGDQSPKFTFDEKKRQRLSQILQAALKQSGRLYLPELVWIEPISSWPAASGYFGDIEGKNSLLKAFDASLEPVFVNGPESGFSEAELKILRGLGYAGVSLGRNVLRTETAAISACAMLGGLLQ